MNLYFIPPQVHLRETLRKLEFNLRAQILPSLVLAAGHCV